jgi:hypothetical protein
MFSIETLGYLASAVIIISLLMRSIVRLRAVNLAGAAMFSAYGFLIGSYPIGVLNLVTSTINIVQLVRLHRRHERFRLLEIRSDSPYLAYLLEVQSQDIRKFFPRFARQAPRENELVLVVLRDLVPAGVLLGTIADDSLHVSLDYVLPQYRDLKVGRFLFMDQIEFFRGRGISRIVGTAETAAHARYLQSMGFDPSNEPNRYVLHVPRQH